MAFAYSGKTPKPGDYQVPPGSYFPPQPLPNDWPVPPSGGQYPGNYYPGPGPVQTMGAPGGPLDTNPNTGVTPPDYSQGGYQTADAGGADPWAAPPSKDISQSEWDQWRKDNPGDEGRWQSAFPSKSGSSANQTPTQAWNAQPNNPRSDAFFDLLMKRIQQGTAVDRNDPNIRSQVDPLVAQMERQSRNYLDQQAESAGPIANLRGEQRLASERTGQAAGQLEAQVIGREIDARRQEIAQALQLYGSRLSDTERQALERELAYLSDATQRRGQDIGLDEFLRELALRQWQAQDDSNYRWGSLGG